MTSTRPPLGLAPGEQLALGQVYYLNPAALVLGPNVCSDVDDDDPDFDASLAEHGVLQTISCYLDGPDVVVTMGQRRAVHAARAGVTRVPVLIVDRPDGPDRIIEQLAENDRRRPSIRAADRAAGIAQLEAFGLSVDQIVKRTGYRRAQVDAALAVARSEAASRAAAASPTITLDQAAAIAEFEGDDKVVEELATAVERGSGFDHVVQRARDHRRDAADKARVTAELVAAGYRVLPERPPHDGPAAYLNQLGLAESAHRRCPGHAAFVSQHYDRVDGRNELVWGPIWVCSDARTHHPRQQKLPGAEDPAAAAQRAEVIRLNREWRSAEIVRRRWLRDFARARTAAPLGAEQWIAATLIRGDVAGEILLGDSFRGGHRLLRALLTRDGDPPTGDPSRDAELLAAREAEIDKLLSTATKAAPRRAVRTICALLLAAWETKTDVHTWRGNHYAHPTAQTRHYLGQMIAWGYEPSDVERLALVDPADRKAPATNEEQS